MVKMFVINHNNRIIWSKVWKKCTLGVCKGEKVVEKVLCLFLVGLGYNMWLVHLENWMLIEKCVKVEKNGWKSCKNSESGSLLAPQRSWFIMCAIFPTIFFNFPLSK